MNKKIVYSIIVFLCFSSFFFLNKTAEAAKEEAEAFPKKLEKYLQKSEYYYHKNSLQLKDTKQIEGVVDKIVIVDNPETPENEEKREKYNSTVIMSYSEYHAQRDSIFFFDVNDVFFYDVDNDVFLNYGEVSLNGEVQAFFNNHKDHLKREISMFSLILMLVLLFSAVIIFPIFILMRNSGEDRNTTFIIDNSKRAHLK